MSTGLRNGAIVVVLALAVFALPGGRTSAAFLGGLFSTLILAALVFAAWRSYREHRLTLYGLGDRHRGILYASVGAIVLAAAGSGKLLGGAGPGVLLWIALVAGGVGGFVVVYRGFKSYG